VKIAAGSLLGIINDILDFSKIEAGRLDIEAAGFQFEDVLQNLAVVVGQKATEKNLEFLISASSDVPSNLVGDPLRLGQILVNLVNNSVKFTSVGEVMVSARVPGEAQVYGARYGDWDDAGTERTVIPSFRAGRYFHHAEVRRNGTRPID
jgi:signal transduction histidine kinase